MTLLAEMREPYTGSADKDSHDIDVRLQNVVDAVFEKVEDEERAGRTATIVTEFVNNIVDHNDPRIGKVEVRRDSVTGAISVLSQGASDPKSVEILRQRVRALRLKLPEIPDIDVRYNTRVMSGRHRGRGLYWVAQSAGSDRGVPQLYFRRLENRGEWGDLGEAEPFEIEAIVK